MTNPLDQLRLLIESEDIGVAQVAKKALQYRAEYDAGNLDEEEYKDLMEDLAHGKEIQSLADTLATKQLLASALSGAMALV